MSPSQDPRKVQPQEDRTWKYLSETPKYDFVHLKARDRFRKLKVIAVLLFLLGLASLSFVLAYQFERSFLPVSHFIETINSVIFEPAFAQDNTSTDQHSFSPRVIVIFGVFVVLGIVYFASIYRILFGTRGDQLDTATDLAKTLTGFFVGAATSFLG